jgi:lauroyl/myristoyl acyltransferase
MTSKQNRAIWHHNQTHRSRLVSPGDFTYVFASLLLSGMQLLPASQRVRVVNKVSAFLGWLLHVLNVHSAKTIRDNLNRVLGPDRSPHRTEADLRRLLSLTAWNALMINSLPVFPREQIANLVPTDGIACLDDRLNGGHPVLIWSFHFGVHPLVVAAILHARGYPIHAVTHVRHMPADASAFRRLYLQRLRRIGDQFPVIDPREGMKRSMLDVLRNKECLYVTPDYMIPANEIQPESAFVVPIDFLGRRAWLQTGGLRLPKRLKAQVVTVLSTQDNGDARRLIVEPFELPTSGLTPADLQRDLEMCMRRLEAHVLAHPYLWWDLKRDDLVERLTMISQGKSGDTHESQSSSPQ